MSNKTGVFYENEISYKGITVNLPPGEKWKVIGTYRDNFDEVKLRGFVLVQLKGNKITGFIEVGSSDDKGVYASYMNSFYNQFLFQKTSTKVGYCIKDSDDLVFKLYKQGTTYNCFRVRSWHESRGLYNPTPVEYPNPLRLVRKFIEKNNIEIPKMLLRSEHYYFSRKVRSQYSWVNYTINPEIYNSYKNKKKYTNNWIKLSAKRHQIFEKDTRAEKNIPSKLNLNELIGEENKPIEYYMENLAKVEKTKKDEKKLKKQKEKTEKEKEEKLKKQKEKAKKEKEEKEKKEKLRKQKEKAEKEKEEKEKKEKKRKQKEKAEKDEELKKEIKKKEEELKQLLKEKKAEEERKKIEEAKKKEELKRKEKEEKEKKKRKIEKSNTTETNVVEQIKDLKKMYDEGVLTEEQFENAKNKILEK